MQLDFAEWPALQTFCTAGSAAAAESAIQIAELNWGDLDGSENLQPADSDDSFDSRGSPSEAYLADLEKKQSSENLSALLRRTILRALEAFSDFPPEVLPISLLGLFK